MRFEVLKYQAVPTENGDENVANTVAISNRRISTADKDSSLTGGRKLSGLSRKNDEIFTVVRFNPLNEENAVDVEMDGTKLKHEEAVRCHSHCNLVIYIF